jgi:hypothetical protein
MAAATTLPAWAALGPAQQSFACVLLLTLAIAELAALLPRAPRATAAMHGMGATGDAATTAAAALRAPAPRRAALVYFGNVGMLAYDQKEQALRGKRAWDLDAATRARGYVAEHVVAAAAAQGWALDTFAHTWSAQFADELRPLVGARAGFAAGPVVLAGGERATSGMIESADAALAMVANASRAYDRVLLLRYDTVFYTDFDFDALANASALYVASWCRADRAKPPAPARAGARACYRMKTFWGDAEGVPDFWFAGALAPLRAVFTGGAARLRPGGGAVVGRTCGGGCGHARVLALARAAGVPLARARWHQMDGDIARDAACGFKHALGAEGGFMNLSANIDGLPPPPPGESDCRGSLCAVYAGEGKCAAFLDEKRPWRRALGAN